MRRITFFCIAACLFATIASAQMRSHPGMTNGGSMQLVVAADGTAVTFDGTNVVAFTPAGTKAWSVQRDAHQLALAGTLLIVTDDDELTALQLSNGTKAWSLDLDGFAMNVQSAANQLYVLVMKNADRQRMMGSGGRELVAVSFSGVALWKQPL